ncbi:ABC transporter permease [Candidatus Sumerlaeota bacterium]|nr:ABC transporter permease [Candidatus Sumerlaeota bacterium]
MILEVPGIDFTDKSKKIADTPAMDSLSKHVRFFTSRPSRVTGYAGCNESAGYIIQQLKFAGIADYEELEFETAAPIAKNAYLDAGVLEESFRIPLHPLWPNMARTCQTASSGIHGPLVDGKKGKTTDLKGKVVSGAIVILDWDSHLEWMNIPEFGGKAVIFRGNYKAPGNICRNKFLTVPADIPRYYVEEKDALLLDALLAKENPSGTIFCEMEWRKVTGKNILARVQGSDISFRESDVDKSPIVFTACYDSVSVVPDLSPGAQQCLGAASLLELIKYWKGRKIDRPVYALFTSGHGQAMAGIINFTGKLQKGLKDGWASEESYSLLARMGRPALFVELDVSGRSDRFGIFCMGRLRSYPEGHLRYRFSALGQKLEEFGRTFCCDENSTNSLSNFVDGINVTLGRNWNTYFPYQAPFESEIPILAGFPAVTLATINDDRHYIDTPDDSLETIDFDLLERQIVSEMGDHIGLDIVTLGLLSWKGPFVSAALEDWWTTLSGRVVWLDQEKNYTPNEPLAHALVFLKTRRADKYLMGTRGVPAVFTDQNGRFEFDGMIKALLYGQWYSYHCSMEAYGSASDFFIDANPAAYQEYLKTKYKDEQDIHDIDRDGSIIYAIDMARPEDYPWTTKMIKRQQRLNLVCFPCKSITMLGLTDARGFVPLKDITILDVGTQSPPFQFGFSAADIMGFFHEENCFSVWADPKLKVRLTMGMGFVEKRLILINNSPENPVGEGFVLEDISSIPSITLQGGSDLWNLDESRIRKLSLHGINNPRINLMHEEAKEHLEMAKDDMAKLDYQNSRSAAEKALSLESRAYAEILATINNMIKGVIFYLALLLPFSYCLERLVIASENIKRRIRWIMFIFLLGFVILTLVHPAFRFTMTPLIVLLAFIIIIFAGVVSSLLVARLDNMLKERKQASYGIHEDKTQWANILIRAIDLGIANIRRRPRRALLTGATITLVTFILLSFTSLVPTINISKLKHPEGEPVYKGLFARHKPWWDLSPALYNTLKRNYEKSRETETGEKEGAVVSGRAWFFSDYWGNLSQIDLTAPRAAGAESEDQGAEKKPPSFTAVALLCMDYKEPLVTGVDKSLVAGRWFKDEDEVGIILPRHITGFLNLGENDIGAPVMVYGQKLPLLGIYDERKFDEIHDIDGEPLTPVNFVLQQQIKAKENASRYVDMLDTYVHYPSDQVAIVPLKYGMQVFSASLKGVAVKTPPGLDPEIEAEKFTKRADYTILASDGNKVMVFSAYNASQLSAAGQILIPLLLGFLMVLGTMLGSVFERKREIFVYNSVGLSPMNVSSLFLAESSVYAIIGAAVGYLLGQVISKILLLTGSLSGLTLNYSASSTIFVTFLTMTIVLLSTIYPAKEAYHAAVPESRREDDEEDDVKTAQDRISSYLPFVTSQEYVLAMQAYLWEYLESLEGVTIGKLGIDSLSAHVESCNDENIPVLSFRAWLAPFDLGVSHDAQIKIRKREGTGVHQFHLTAVRFTGDQQNWRRLTPFFIQGIRKQLLLWRILSDEERRRYSEKGRILFSGKSETSNPEDAYERE